MSTLKNESAMTQRSEILLYLLEGNGITSFGALKLFGCINLSGRVSELRHWGYSIDGPFIKTKSGKRVKLYAIRPKGWSA